MKWLHLSSIDKVDQLMSQERKLAFFDDLISNSDCYGNTLSSEKRIIAIDHGFAFGNTANKLGDTESAFHEPVKIQLDLHRTATTPDKSNLAFKKLQALMPQKEIYERLVNTKADEWKKLLGPHLTTSEVRGFLETRSKIIDVVEKARLEMGDRIFPTRP